MQDKLGPAHKRSFVWPRPEGARPNEAIAERRFFQPLGEERGQFVQFVDVGPAKEHP
jgi:hypothetical protein